MKSCFPLGVRNCECISQASEVGLCFISKLASLHLPGMDGGGEDAVYIC